MGAAILVGLVLLAGFLLVLGPEAFDARGRSERISRQAAVRHRLPALRLLRSHGVDVCSDTDP